MESVRRNRVMIGPYFIKVKILLNFDYFEVFL